VHGVPARVLPVAVWHTASVGLDSVAAAIAHGASQVWVLLTDEEAPDYRRALAEQMAVAQAILHGLGYRGEHCRLIERATRAARSTPPARRAGADRRPAGASPRRPTSARRWSSRSNTCWRSAAAARPTRSRCRRPARRSALRVDTDRCTLCLAASAPAPRPRWPTTRTAAAALHREELRAVRPVRQHLPGRRDPLRAAPVARRRRQGAQGRAVLNEASPIAASAAPSPSARCARSRR
jgi:hypothetical protein